MTCLYITEHGSSLSIKDGYFVVESRDGSLRKIPQEILESVALFGNANVSVSCIKLLLSKEIPVLYFSSKSVDLKQKIEDLQETERFRNITAHEIVSVSDEWMKKETGHNAKQIMDLIKKLMGIIFSRSDEVWNSYEEMNDFIIAKLNY